MIAFLSLKLDFYLLVYDRNIFRSSSEVFGNLWLSSEIFKKCLEMFVWPLDILKSGWKSLENCQNCYVQYRSKVSYHLSSRFSRASSRFSRESLMRLVWHILHVGNRLCVNDSMSNRWDQNMHRSFVRFISNKGKIEHRT